VDGARPIRAEVVLVTSGRDVPLGDIRPTVRCDLALVDALARMQLAAGRMGWRIRLVDVDADLAELMELVGLSEVLAGPPD
jgi:hypothetical protein